MECRHKINKTWKRKSNNHLIVILFFLLAFFTSCSNKEDCDFITRSFEKQCSEEIAGCAVTFKETFNFDWDTMYIFDSMLYPSEISTSLGIEYDGEIVPVRSSLPHLLIIEASSFKC